MARSEIRFLLVMNEPNLIDQANRTPAQASINWVKYELVISDLAAHGRVIYLVGSAITEGTMTNYSDPLLGSTLFTLHLNLLTAGEIPKSTPSHFIGMIMV